MLEQYLHKVGLDEKEQRIYLALAEMGVQPASVIARKCRLDRVTTYKHLKKLAELGFVKIYYEHSTQRFGVESFEHIEMHLKEQKQSTEELINEFPLIHGVLQGLKDKQQLIPKLQIYEGENGIRSCFRDLLFEVKLQKLKQVRMLTSNTFDERLGGKKLSTFVSQLFDDIRKQKIDVEIFEATGAMIPERLQQVSLATLDPEKLPAARGATNIFLVGQVVYLTCYKQSQIGLKIKHAEISQIFHFLFDMMGKMS